MKKSLIYMAALFATAGTFSSCDDDFEVPPMIEPVATMKVNTTIADLKAEYWREGGQDYYTPILLNSEGDSVVIGGRVISSDLQGNLFQQLIVEDETGAIEFSVSVYDLNQKYQYGQEVRINVTGMNIGLYRNLMKIGGVYNNGIGRLDEKLFTPHIQVNGLPRPSAVDTITVTIPDVMEYKSTTAGLQEWESRLVKFEGVSFEGGGSLTYATPGGTSGTIRVLKDASGNTIDMRTNDRSKFADKKLPAGTGNVTAILSYYNSNWQLSLIDTDGCQGFDETPDNPDTPDTPAGDGNGSMEKPYSADQVIAFNPQSTTDVAGDNQKNVWVEGYIVGSYDNYTANFTAENANPANILLALSPDANTKESTICVQLLNGSETRAALNLKDNPTNLGKKCKVYGDILKYNSLPGVKNTSNFEIDGKTGTEKPEPGAVIYSQTFKEAQGDFTIDNISMSDALTYVWMHDSKYGYMKASAYVNNASHASDSWLTSPIIDLTTATSPVLTFDHLINKFPSIDVAKEQVSMAIRIEGGEWQTTAVPTWSNNDGWTFVNSGNISLDQYKGKKIQVGFHYTSTDEASGTWEIKNFLVSEAN